MRTLIRHGLAALALVGSTMSFATASAQNMVTLNATVSNPMSVALDSSGNLYYADNAGVFQLTASSGYSAKTQLGTGISRAWNVTIDSKGNIFFITQDGSASEVDEMLAAGGYTTIQRIGGDFINQATAITLDRADNLYLFQVGAGSVTEFTAANGYATKTTLGSNLSSVVAIAADGAGNLFVTTDEANDTSFLYELSAANGYTPNKLAGSFRDARGVAIDSAGNLFVSDSGSDPIEPTGYNPGGIYEVTAASGYGTAKPLGFYMLGPLGIAVDRNDNVFVANEGLGTLTEILSSPPLVVASVLPGTRSVQIGTTATFYATMINTGAAALHDCQVDLTGQSAPLGLRLGYQTTSPTTNALIGTPNTPVTIPAGNGVQTFLLSLTFQSTVSGAAPFEITGMPINFNCSSSVDPWDPGTVINAAAVVPGVDTIDLAMSSAPTADIIALSSTPSNNGIVEMPIGGSGAFAVATDNLGAASQITASIDTGAVTLPAAFSICQTNPSTGQCLSPPASSVALDFAGGATPTFSVFVQPSAKIALDPANARVFVRFTDVSGARHGATSVAVETN